MILTLHSNEAYGWPVILDGHDCIGIAKMLGQMLLLKMERQTEHVTICDMSMFRIEDWKWQDFGFFVPELMSCFHTICSKLLAPRNEEYGPQ